MKRIALTCFLCLIGLISTAQTNTHILGEDEAARMIKKYAGFGKNHSDKEGVLVNKQQLIDLLNAINSDTVLLKFARTLNYVTDPDPGDNDKTKVTILIGVPRPGKPSKKGVYHFHFQDLTRYANLCPLPRDCAVEQR